MTSDTRPPTPAVRAAGQPEPPTAESSRRGVIDCAVYRQGHRLPGVFGPKEARERCRREDEFVWIGLFEPSSAELGEIAAVFGLHELAVEDAVQAYQRPKLERYTDNLFLVLKSVRHVADDSPATASEIVDTGEVMVFLGKDFIITVRHRDHSRLGALRAELEAMPERLANGPAAVLHGIADHVVDDYLEATDAFERSIDEVEGLVFNPRSVIGPEQMHLMKREIVELRRSVLPLAGPLDALTRHPLVPAAVSSYFRDVEDHLQTVAERITSFDEILTTLLNATLAKVTIQQNNDMRRITAWAAVIAVPTMVFGVYGMNFDHMPELHWRYGYPLIVTVTLVACLVLHRAFKRNRWL